jgi:hypothetical protein
MKHHALIAVVFVIGCATGGVAAQLVVPPVRAGTSPTRWEYPCASAREEARAQEDLNKLGAEGWELVGVTVGSFRYTLCAKRALP